MTHPLLAPMAEDGTVILMVINELSIHVLRTKGLLNTDWMAPLFLQNLSYYVTRYLQSILSKKHLKDDCKKLKLFQVPKKLPASWPSKHLPSM